MPSSATDGPNSNSNITGEANMAAPSAPTRSSLPLTLIAATTLSNGIGAASRLPWRLKKEMAYFKRVTETVVDADGAPLSGMNAVVMGRKSWESIPPRFRPLKGRANVVISRGATADMLGVNDCQDTLLCNSFASAVQALSDATTSAPSMTSSSPTSPFSAPVHRVFLTGGAHLYSQSLRLPHPSERPSPSHASTDPASSSTSAAGISTSTKKKDEDEDDLSNVRAHVSTLLITRILSPAFPQCDVFLPEFRSDAQVAADEALARRQGEVAPDAMAGPDGGEPHTFAAAAAAATGAGADSFRQARAGKGLWERASHDELERFVGFEVPRGVVQEDGVRYEFQMWTHR